MRWRDLAVCTFLAGMSFCEGLAAEPLPRPQVDFRLNARTVEDGRMSLARGTSGRMRVELTRPGSFGSMTGLIDFMRNRMLMIVAFPGMEGRAVDLELPADFALVDLGGEGTLTTTDTVAAERCDVWRTQEKHSGTFIDSCITPDGITLRAVVDVNGKRTVVFEALDVARGEQDPALFDLPKGVKVTKLPSSMKGLLPSLLP